MGWGLCGKTETEGALPISDLCDCRCLQGSGVSSCLPELASCGCASPQRCAVHGGKECAISEDSKIANSYQKINEIKFTF